MKFTWLQHVKDALANLNPQEVREEAERPLSIGLHAGTETAYLQMENFLVPRDTGEAQRTALRNVIFRARSAAAPPVFDLEIFSQELRTPNHGFSFTIHNPEKTVRDVLKYRPELRLSLARHVAPFREPVIRDVIKKVSKENALFSLATALPDVVPLLSLPWAIGEFASDTAFLTANQIRMAFLLAAAYGRPVGYREQKGEIASIIAGAFGWRAIARELVGKIPLGGGLLPKAAVAYAGTRVAGLSLERYYRFGSAYTPDERRVAYEDALAKGRALVSSIVDAIRHRQLIRG